MSKYTYEVGGMILLTDEKLTKRQARAIVLERCATLGDEMDYPLMKIAAKSLPAPPAAAGGGG